MSNKLQYKGEIVHFIGGINDYIGEIDQAEHPNGKGWVRIKNACRYVVINHPNKPGWVNENIVRVQRDDKAYRPFVDLYCPFDSLVEIRVLNKDGNLYKTYMKELKRVSLDRIISPSQADIVDIKKK